jgi:putative flippase GtrA
MSHLKQAQSFIIAGVLGSIIEFIIIHIGVDILGWSTYITYIPSAIIPSIFVFFFNKHITFKAKKTNAKKETTKFVLVYTFTFFLNYGLALLLFSIAQTIKDHNVFLSSIAMLTEGNIAILAKAASIGCCAFVNYFLSHSFIFSERKKHETLPITL